jgi:mannose-6-phosphate isomerase
LDSVNVKEGDAFFLETGTVHAIGGLLVAEIQQTSDITYRLYDFDRVDAQGNTREHVDLALEAINYKRVDTRIEYLKEEMSQIQL